MEKGGSGAWEVGLARLAFSAAPPGDYGDPGKLYITVTSESGKFGRVGKLLKFW